MATKTTYVCDRCLKEFIPHYELFGIIVKVCSPMLHGGDPYEHELITEKRYDVCEQCLDGLGVQVVRGDRFAGARDKLKEPLEIPTIDAAIRELVQAQIRSARLQATITVLQQREGATEEVIHE